MVRSLPFLLSLLALWFDPGLGRSGALEAQGCSSFSITCPGDRPPVITFSPITGATSTSPLPVTIYLSDDINLNASTLQVTLTGATSTSSFPLVWSGAPSSAYATGPLQLQVGSNNTITAHICDYANHCSTASATYTYTPPPPQQNTIAQSQDHYDATGCAACAVGAVGYSTPAYVSLDAQRSVSLSYSSATAHPMGLVQVDAVNNSSPPEKMSIQLLRNGTAVDLTSGGQELFFQSGSGTTRLTAQFDAAGLATGAYDYTVVLRSWVGTSHTDATLPVRILIDNEQGSVFGAGWTLPGLKRLYAQANGSILMTDGTGAVSYYALISCSGNDCTYQSPVGDYSKLVKHAPNPSFDNSVYTHSYGDSTAEEFYGDGLQRHAKDRFGNLVRFDYEYPANGPRLFHITDPAGLVSTFAYDGNGKLSSITIPSVTGASGRTSTLSVDASGDLRTIMDPDNVAAFQTTTYSQHRLQSFQDRTLAQTDLAYDVFGQLALSTGAQVNTTDAGLYRPVTTVRSLEIAVLPSGGNGLSLSGAVSRLLPTEATLQVTAPRGERTTVSQHVSGQLLRVEQNDLAGKVYVTTYDYDANNYVKSIKSPSNGTVTYVWSLGRLDSVTDQATGAVQSLTYAKYDQLKQMLLNGNVVQQNLFNADSLAPASTVKNGTDTTSFTYDTRGRVLTVIDGEQHSTSMTYETSAGFNAQSVTDNGKTITFGHDAYGRLQTVTDPAGRVGTVAYDVLDRTTSITPAGVGSTQYGYNDATRTYTTTDPKAHTYTRVLDARGSVISRTDPAGASIQFAYDKDGNVTSVNDRRGNTIASTYDKFGRVLTRTAGGLTTTFAYDPDGRWVSAQNGESTDTLFTDVDGRTATEKSVRSGVRYYMSSSYDPAGMRQTLTDSAVVISTGARQWGHRLFFGYDNSARQNLVTDFSDTATSWTFNKDGAPNVITMPTGTSAAQNLTRALTFTPAHRLSTSAFNFNPASLNHTYSYDVLERISQRDRGASSDAYYRRAVGYDEAGRLANFTDIHHWIQLVRHCTGIGINNCYWVETPHDDVVRSASYTYDDAGNRTDHSGTSDNRDRLTSFDGFTLTYDADGNLTHKVKSGVIDQTLTWDALGQLTQVATAGGSTVTFGYDGFGRRIRKTVNGVTTRFLYDGLNLVEELNDPGNPIRRYSYYPGVDQPHAVLQSADSSVYFYTTEQPGSVVALVNKSNAVVNTYEYDAFGNAVAQSEQVPQPFRFAGAFFDAETGLYFMRARYYDPQLGRFVSEDPVGIAGDENLFAYVENDPVNMNDPTGLDNCPKGYHLIKDFDESDGSHVWICQEDGGAGRISIVGLPPVRTTGRVPYDYQSGKSGRGPNTLLNFGLGFVDGLTLGLASPALQYFGVIQNVDRCSAAYRIGGLASMAVGMYRAAYVGLVELNAMMAESGLAASAGREALKYAFRFGLLQNLRKPNLARYGGVDLAIRLAAGRTNPFINAAGTIALVGGLSAAGGCH